MKIQLIDSPPLALNRLIRASDTHKGLYGTVAIIGGATHMIGAALLAGRAALHLGCGKVYVATLNSNLFVDFSQPELMICNPKSLMNNDTLSHILIGPGLGQNNQAKLLLNVFLKSDHNLIIDADGLNLIANSKKLQSLLKHRQANTIITPHPAEAARLLNLETKLIQSDRTAAVTKLYENYACHIILKGHETLILGPDKVLYQNTSGNAALSSAGQGDVLAGVILSLWAQGLSCIEACKCGVYLHGQAADLWRNQNDNRIGLTASQTIEYTQLALNQFLAKAN